MDDKVILNEIVKWWEKKRLLFNIIILLTGLFCILTMGFGFLLIFEFVGIIVFGVVVNIFYSLGIIVEIFDLFYFKSKLKLHNYRLLFLLPEH